MPLLEGKIRTNGKGSFVDGLGRIIQLKGINLDAGSKYPKTPNFTSHKPVRGNEGLFFDGDHVSFVGRPFPLEEVSGHIKRIKSLGYNSIRYIFTWEAIEHEGPGKYDESFIDYTIQVLKIIDEIGGVYVYFDPHQDVWSRFSGGDGAPMWTLYAAGFDPKNFEKTEAAILQNYFPHDPKAYPKMLWTTNYKRLVVGSMFTLFFAGKVFAPKAIINGMNIQTYLQDHFIASVAHLVRRIKEVAPYLFEQTIIGVETLNEPNPGYIGIPDIDKIPDNQNLRLGTCPTIFQSVKLGVGIPTEVDEYKISVFGPTKTGTKYIDPEETISWLTTGEYDTHYGFRRGPEWKLGECIWAQHGVWDAETTTLLDPGYFRTDPLTGANVDEEYFINRYYVKYYRKFRGAIRAILPETFIFLQSPPLQIPPKLKGTDLVDKNTVFCPHYYDGMSLMFKSWNRKYNVDTLGIMRGRYSNPVFGIVLGESNIRKSFKRQLFEMALESQDNLGEEVPVMFTEIGMPFDMDDKKAYDDDDFSSQTSALDALGFALEGSNLSHSWWCYTADNCHKWGDRFNNEDFSFWSKDDDLDSNTLVDSRNLSIANRKKLGFQEHSASVTDFDSDSGTLAGSSSALKNYYGASSSAQAEKPSHEGLRAIDSVIRPYPLSLNGEFINAEFDLAQMKYTLQLKGNKVSNDPTRVYIPRWHFPPDEYELHVSSGTISVDESFEVVNWFHKGGEQTITIKNINVKEVEQGWLAYFLSLLSCFS